MFTLLICIIVNTREPRCFRMIREDMFGALWTTLGCPAMLLLPFSLRELFRKLYQSKNGVGLNEIGTAFAHGFRGLGDAPITLRNKKCEFRLPDWAKSLRFVVLESPHFSLARLFVPKHAPLIMIYTHSKASGEEKNALVQTSKSVISPKEGENVTLEEEAQTGSNDISETIDGEKKESSIEEEMVQEGGAEDGKGEAEKGREMKGESEGGYANEEGGGETEVSAISLDDAGMAPPEPEGGVEEEKGYSVDGVEVKEWIGDRLKALAETVGDNRIQTAMFKLSGVCCAFVKKSCMLCTLGVEVGITHESSFLALEFLVCRDV